MFDPNTIVSTIVDVLLLPLQFLLIPVDALLNNIPNIASVPEAITSIISFVGTLPSTLVSLTGLAPFLWNALFLVFLLYIGSAPSINLLKRVWAWVRP